MKTRKLICVTCKKEFNCFLDKDDITSMICPECHEKVDLYDEKKHWRLMVDKYISYINDFSVDLFPIRASVVEDKKNRVIVIELGIDLQREWREIILPGEGKRAFDYLRGIFDLLGGIRDSKIFPHSELLVEEKK